MKNIQIRCSQFITTYGVGSLVDGENGPCIMLNFDKSEIFRIKKIKMKYISNLGISRLAKQLKFIEKPNINFPEDGKYDKIGIFQLPANAQIPVPEKKPIYRIRKFPSWSLCQDHKGFSVLYYRYSNEGVCPKCLEEGKHKKKFSSDSEVIRFVKICPEGHLNDVGWSYEVHKKVGEKGECTKASKKYFIWEEKGTELGQVEIRCVDCSDHTTLKKIMEDETPCSGVYIENFANADKEKDYRKGTEYVRCGKPTQLIPRNASNVFISDIITSISLPEEANAFYNVFNFEHLSNDIKINYTTTKIDYNYINNIIQKAYNAKPKIQGVTEPYVLLKKINNLSEPKKSNEIKKIDDIITYYLKCIDGSNATLSEIDFRKQEFEAFHTGKSASCIDPTLIIDVANGKIVPYHGLEFKATPIPRLEIIMVQEGYKRICYLRPKKNKKKSTAKKTSSLEEDDELPSPKLVWTPYITEKNSETVNWYPGVKLHGEGIFIEIKNPNDLFEKLLKEPQAKIWRQVCGAAKEYEKIITEYELKKREKALKKKSSQKKELDKDEDRDNLMKILKPVFQQNGFVEETESDDKSDDTTKKQVKRIMEWFNKFRFRKMTPFTDPITIWWHTLSHRLIRALAKDCGYSSASLRERIYFDPEKNEGGVLIFSARPGEDGTMGGLVTQVQNFDRIIGLALDEINIASNDPICGMHEFRPVDLNGAACYSCLFLSETSCEFGNIGLDRNLLKNVL